VQHVKTRRDTGSAGNDSKLDGAVTLRRGHTTVNGSAKQALRRIDRGAGTFPIRHDRTLTSLFFYRLGAGHRSL
jgi:hypothetical protein